MLKYLDFEVTFSRTNKTFKGQHEFNSGLTSITGPNEAGKSLRLEMIRYGLFGAKALRSDAKSYTKIMSQVHFDVGDKGYFVKREGNKSNLYDGNLEPIATGTKPVNEKIISILGYNLDVFDVSNACLQDEINALSQKSPAERRRMVDKTLGLEAVDKLIADTKQEISSNNKVIATLKEMTDIKLNKPSKPDIDKSVDQLEDELKELEAQLADKNRLQGQLDLLKCEEPKIDEGLYELIKGPDASSLVNKMHDLRENFEKEKDTFLSEISRLSEHFNRLDKYPDLTAEDISTYIKDNYHQDLLKHKDYMQKKGEVEECSYTEQELEEVKLALTHKEMLEKKLEVSCPECSHEFLVNGDGKTETKEEVDYSILDRLKVNSVYDIAVLSEKLSKYKEFLKLEQPSVPPMQLIDESQEWFDLVEYSIDMERETLDKYLEQLKKITADYETMVAEIKSKVKTITDAQDQITAYENKKAAFEKYQEFTNKNGDYLLSLEGVEHIIGSVKNSLALVRDYDNQITLYNSEKNRVEAMKQDLEVAEKENAELSRVRDSLLELKPKVKMHLMPSLNAVASELLSQMTDGKRNKVQINEEFEILIDNQLVNELSGSAKAVANLAIRIGLGMVLTNKVFSVFLTDEVDAAMDDERAAYTAECLRNLKDTISQIILVSHKQPEVDNEIKL